MKRLITLLLSLTLVMSTFFIQPVSVSASGDNLAIGKTVTASSTSPNYKTEHINDGNLETNWVRNDLVPGEWIMIDLGEAYRINSVVLHTRHDVDHEDYRKRVALEFSNTPDFAQKERIIAMGESPTAFKEAVEVPISIKTPYRYVRAVKTDVFIFVLAEMEIYGELVDPDALILGDDVAGSRQENVISMLSYLGLIKPVTENIFGVDHLMTRAEAAQAVVDAFGGVTGGGTIPFSDVPETHRNCNAVKAAYNMGYITGDGTGYYRPNDYITKQEVMYMTLRALGYGDAIRVFTELNMSNRVFKLADDTELFKGVPMEKYDEPISRGDIATVFYNALLAPEYKISFLNDNDVQYKKGEDLLRSRYNVVLTEGVVEENCISTLDGNTKKDDEKVVIGGRVFKDTKGVLNAYLGKSVIAASYIDSKEIFYAWQTEDNEEVVIPASHLTATAGGISSGKITAENSDGKSRNYSLADDFYVIKNGVADPYWQPSDLLIQNGQLRLIDNNSTGGYDVVLIEEYTIHYLVSAFSDGKELTIVDTNNERKTVALKNLAISDAFGKTQPTRKVGKDTVVKLYSTPDGENCRIILFNEPIDGILTTVSQKDAIIDGEKYLFSYNSNIKNTNTKVGEAVIAYIDEAGEILWIQRDADADVNWTVAFSQAYDVKNESFSAQVRFRLFTQDGKWVMYSVADKVIVDGVSMKVADFASVLTGASGQNIYDKELFRYKLNDDGQIKAIDTIVKTSAENDAGITFSKMDSKITEGMFTRDSSAFWSQHIMLCQAYADTPTFVLPVVAGSFTTNSDFDDVYGMSTVIDIAGNRSNKAQNLQGYMPDEDGFPAFFVTTSAYSASAMSGSNKLTSVTTSSSPQMVVEEVTEELSGDGDVVLRVKGRNVDTQKEDFFVTKTDLAMIETGLLYQEKPDCLSSDSGSKNWVSMNAVTELSETEKAKYINEVTDIGFGDIVRYQQQGSTVRAVERIFDYNSLSEPVGGDSPKGDTWYTVGGSYPDYYHGTYRYQFGRISSATKNTFTLTTIANNTETYLKSAFAKIWVVDGNTRDETITEATEAHQFASSEQYKTMIYSNTGAPKIIIIYVYE